MQSRRTTLRPIEKDYALHSFINQTTVYKTGHCLRLQEKKRVTWGSKEFYSSVRREFLSVTWKWTFEDEMSALVLSIIPFNVFFLLNSC